METTKERYHYLYQYLASAQHKITVDLIGVGGTGSHMLTNLAVLSETFKKFERTPFFVRAYDPDTITENNVGRQMFSMSDIGRNKAEVLVERCNRYFGTEWTSRAERFNGDSTANITISCVDSVKSRKEIYAALKKDPNKKMYLYDYNEPYYWLDIGNSRKTGQIILGTLFAGVKSEKNKIIKLKNFFDEFPDVADDETEPSCSLAEALSRQDLFINKIMATYASNMLWQLFKDFRINYRGVYVNLETMNTRAIPV